MRIFLNCTEFTTKVNDVVWCPYTRIACVLHFISDIIIDDKNHHPLWHGINKPSCHYCPLDILVFCFTKPKSLSYKIDYKSQLPSNNSRLNTPPHEYINTYIYLIQHQFPISTQFSIMRYIMAEYVWLFFLSCVAWRMEIRPDKEYPKMTIWLCKAIERCCSLQRATGTVRRRHTSAFGRNILARFFGAHVLSNVRREKKIERNLTTFCLFINQSNCRNTDNNQTSHLRVWTEHTIWSCHHHHHQHYPAPFM